MIKRLDVRDIKEIVYFVYENINRGIYLLQGIIWERGRGFIGLRDGSKYYGYYSDGELKCLLLFTAAGSFMPLICDDSIFKKLDLLRIIKENNPSLIKGDTQSVDGVWKIINKVVSGYDIKKCILMRYEYETDGIVNKVDGISNSVADNEDFRFLDIDKIDINTSIGFLLEVEKAFDRNPLSINKLKLKVNNKSEFDDYIFVSRDDDIVGQGLVEFEGPKVALIGGIYSKPEFRRKGIGEAITKELMRRITGRDQDTYLTVLSDNEGALKLYEKLGFVSVEDYYLVNLNLC